MRNIEQLVRDYQSIFRLTARQAKKIAESGITLIGWTWTPGLKLIARIGEREVVATTEELATGRIPQDRA